MQAVASTTSKMFFDRNKPSRSTVFVSFFLFIAMPCRFDNVFGPDATTSDLFETLRDNVAKTADGINVSIIAYGATGSGM